MNPDAPSAKSGATRRQRRRFAAIASLAAAATITLLVAYGHHRDAAPPPLGAAAGILPDKGSAARAPNAPVPVGAPAPQRGERSRAAPYLLPPPDAPLAQTYDTLKARADAGDAAAAARLFKDVKHCFGARTRLRQLPVHASMLADTPTKDLSAEQLAAHEKALADVAQKLRDAERDAEPCNGLSEDELRLAPAAFTAALLGDPDASDCYVSGIPLFLGGLLDHPEWLTQYKANAMVIASRAIEAGDWNMVDELQGAYAPVGFHFGPLADLIAQNPAMSYRLLRLQRLGTDSAGPAAEGLDRQLATTAQELSADAISSGDAWAQDNYSKYFSILPPATPDRRGDCR